MKLSELAIEHDYYCSESNYYSNESTVRYDTWADFYEDYKDADIDMNLCFRWDVHKHDDSNLYWMEIFIMHQRKGIFSPHSIGSIVEDDTDSIVEFMSKHWQKLQSIWNPISKEVSQ